MKKLLTVLIGVLVAINASALGTYYGKCVVNVATNSTNYGLVWVTKSENNPPADNAYLTTDNSTTSSFALGSSITAEFWLYNKPNTGYYHAGWSTNANGSSPIANTNVQPYHLSFSANGSKNSPTTKTYYAVFKEQSVHKDYTRAVAILVDVDGKPQIENETYVKGGGFVNIGASATDQDDVEWGSLTTYVYKNAPSHTWNYEYYATAKPNHKFVGWFEQSALQNQITSSGKVDFGAAESTNPYYNKNNYSSSTLYSNKEDAPSGNVMCAVFRPSLTYYYTGAIATISGDEDERESKGRVYADDGTAGSPNNVTIWKSYYEDEEMHSQVDNQIVTYTYYAKEEYPDKYAFKGWTTTPYGDVSYYDNPFTYSHPIQMTAENASPEKPYVTPTLYAVFEAFFYKTPAVSVAPLSRGSGFVHVSLTPASVDNCTVEEIPASDVPQQVAARQNQHTYTVYYYAKPKPGAEFAGWSSTPDGLSIVSQHAEYSTTYQTTHKSKDLPHVASPLYAVFRSDIDIRQQDRMIVYVDDEGNGNINDAKVLIDFQKGNTLTAALTGDDASYFTLSNRSGSKSGSSITFDATQGLIELVVAYKGDLNDAVDKVANITLSATSGGQNISRPVSITVEEAPIITFLPTDGKGAYKVSMTNGSGINYTMDAATKENVKVPVTHESMSNIEMALTNDVSSDDYYFFGWQIIDGEEINYISYDQLCTYQFTKSVKVRANFVHKDIATYSIVGDATNTQYHDFALAMKDASTLYKQGSPQVVRLNYKRGSTSITSAVLPKGNYTIPEGVRLLIPGTNNYEFKEELAETDYVKSVDEKNATSRYKNFIRWIVEEGTTITVEGGGAICVLAKLACNGGNNRNGMPIDYGHIELKENVNITFESGSNLYAFGYITGPRSSSVVMKNGSFVKEILQIMDWRGGTVMGLGGGITTCERYKIFPISQYYVQNVEAPLTIHSGATEKLTAAILVGSESPTHLDLTFIDINEGFFQLKEGSSMTKYYDAGSDRIQMIVNREVGATEVSFIGNIALNISGVGNIDSKSYVLPIPQNYDIILEKNAIVNVLHDVALLAGSTFYIKQGAICNLGISSSQSNAYVYDKKYSTINGLGYMRFNSEFIPVSQRPDGMKYVRNSASIQDATLLVDGELNVPNGYLYTTNSPLETVDHANITSNGGGKVQFLALGTNTKTYQGQTSDGLITTTLNEVSIPVAPARLLNANGQYQVPAAESTYTYIDGKWTANTSDTRNPNSPSVVSHVPKFTTSDYTTSSYVGKSSTGTTTISTENANVDWTSINLTWNCKLYGEHANQFTCTLGAKSQDAVPVTITFEPKSDGVKTATLRVTATYTYTDTYGVAGTYTYSKDIHLTGNASNLQTNTLAFADLSTLYKGQTDVPLFAGGNNSQPINITCSANGLVTTSGNTTAATISASNIGEVTLTAVQEADFSNNIAATTITKKVLVNDRIIWNWDVLYFGTTNENPVTVLDGSTDWTLTETTDKYNIIDYNATDKTATIADQIAGKYDVTFTFTQNGESQPFTSTVITNPQYLRIDVNNDTVFRAVTLSANDRVGYNVAQSAVEFSSTADAIAQWKLTFIGVPDKLCFTPVGYNTWQIEESDNGVNWTTSFPWKYITSNVAFEWSLLPSTRYVRISYGASEYGYGMLKDLYITELADVKTDVDKLYVPVESDGNGGYKSVTKEIVLTYANTGKLGISTSDSKIFKVKRTGTAEEPTDAFSINATTEENPFGIAGIEVVSTASKETQGYLYIYEGSNLVLQIPIQTYLFPQELPIKLATDKPDGGDRYYYATTHTHNAEWDGTNGVRTITLNNAVSDAAPYLIFAFKGAPTYISFNYTGTAKGTWVIQDSEDGKSWRTATPVEDDAMGGGYLKRTVDATSQYLRVIYESSYAEKIDITNLVIVGNASVVVPARLELDHNVAEKLTVSAINLPSMMLSTNNTNFQVTHGTDEGTYAPELTLTSSDYATALGENVMGDIPIYVKWIGSNAVEYGTLTITNPADSKVLGVVELVGRKTTITDGELNIYTGVPDEYTIDGTFAGTKHRKIDINAAFSAEGNALFDYVVVYGETTTNDGSMTITKPNTVSGSNAKTPCYIYKKNGNTYQLFKEQENANSKDKAWNETTQEDLDAVQIPDGQDELSMYITGFAPYASTGYTKADEGVWYFRANGGQSVDIYLEDCYIYSRAKTVDGHYFIDRQDGYSFVEPYVRGTGAVLVFACNTKETDAMNVTIHMLDSNLLKSHYGCFLQSIAGRAYQASSPVQIRLLDDSYEIPTKTTINFTDEWPDSKNAITGNHTNGFLSLQKQVNNAPSIDMGNSNTIVNFNGGQVQLQNAQIVSHNYKSSLAICPRSGRFAGFKLALGMGTDTVGGTVNFNDGTTTVLPMYVDPKYAESYLLDKDENDNYITNSKGEFLTSCLRTPTNTFVYGGSHCMMRACKNPSSQGGAPKDGSGNALGLYKYPKNPTSGHKGGWSDGVNGLVNPTTGNVPDGYAVNSVTPNNNGTPNERGDDYLNFWFDPNFESAVQPEVDKTISFWKTCMTYIEAMYAGEGGSVGGDTEIEMSGDLQEEIVKYLLYCKIDNDILEVIGDPNYQAPVKNPAPEGDSYLPVKPSTIGAETEHYITNVNSFQVENKLYYITTATADVWNAFTAPFDVANIYIMETYPENELESMDIEWGGDKVRSQILKEQAKHNADFASFFAVTIALGQNKTFDVIYKEYMTWANLQDKNLGLNTKNGYKPRGMRKLVPYNGNNGLEADFYLNVNTGAWDWNDEVEEYRTQWGIPDASDGILLHQDSVYSMLLPFCTGCVEIEEDADGNIIELERQFWDYWSGKFLIFESTEGPHTIHGSSMLAQYDDVQYDDEDYTALLAGNPTFAEMKISNDAIYKYVPSIKHSTFYGLDYDEETGDVIPHYAQPTESFLIPYMQPPIGSSLKGVTIAGKVMYSMNNSSGGVTTDNHTPTVSGGNELFITAIDGGINVAVAEQQYIRVVSSTGLIIYAGNVSSSVDIILPTNGVYVIAGEREVQKIVY